MPKKTNKFLISVILDRTGSMASCQGPTVEGFNNFLQQQKDDPNGEAWFSLTLFDAPQGVEIEERFVAVPIKDVPPLGTKRNPYTPRGWTPLYDAIGTVVRTTEKIADQFDRVLVMIQTDGAENSSKEWRREQIHDLITAKRKEGWAFVFFGADIDAYAAASTIGVSQGSTMAYAGAQSVGSFTATSGSASVYRYSGGATADNFYVTPTVPKPTTTPPSTSTSTSDDSSIWRSK